METMKLKESIMEKLPQIPYVLDQVGEALAWACDVMDEGEFNLTLKITDEVAAYVAKISDPNFYKTHLVLASILSAIPDACAEKRFEAFITSSGATERAVRKLGMEKEEVEEKGCFRSLLLHLATVAAEDEHLFAVALIGIKNSLQEIVSGIKQAEVKTPITSADYITILGYAWVMANLRMANLKMLDSTYKIYNDILVILNNDVNY